jgi:hypothetical protein
MGEIAEMMLDGCLCEQCGDYLGEGDGYPQVCESCQREETPSPPKAAKRRKRKSAKPRKR